MPPSTDARTYPFPLGRYRVLGRLATGGMAEIFLARVDDGGGPDRLVVLKRMLPALASQPDFVTMFSDEARLAAGMHHPSIVQTFDVGRDEQGGCYLAMEHLHGQDLRAIRRTLHARRRTLPIDKAVHVVGQVLSALQYAHDLRAADGSPLRVVHRDVSPQNVLLTYDGAVKLLDFGIARSQGHTGKTRTGTLKGKIGYMSPEQCRGEALDGRSDVFSAAVLLYELTTGRRLYKAASEYEVLKRIVEGPVPSPRALDPAYPADLDRIVVRGLAKAPERRYQSAREMAEDLEVFANDANMLVTPLALSTFLEEMFEEPLAAFRAARDGGQDLALHLVASAEIADEGVDLEASDGLPVPTAADRPLAAPAAGSGASRSARSPLGPPGGAPSIAWTPAVRAHPVPLLVMAGLIFVSSAMGVVYFQHAGRPALAAARAVRGALASVGQRGPATGHLEVVTSPPGAALHLDGRAVPARAPTTIEAVPLGVDHLLVAELPGHHPEVRHLVIHRQGATTRVELQLLPRPDGAAVDPPR